MKNYLLRLLLVAFISFSTTSLIHSQNNALNFDGVDDYVDCGNRLPLSYTKEAWIYITNLSSSNNIISGDPGSPHAFWIPSATLLAGHQTSSGGSYSQVQDPTSLVINTWYHVAVAYDEPTHTMKLYKNGVLVGTPNTNVLPVNNNAHVYIGSYNVGGNVFAGNIDEIRIWNVARTASEIANNMNTSFFTPQTNLVANFRCNQGNAEGNNAYLTVLIDDSATKFNGDLKNFMMVGSTSNFVIGSPTVPVELLSFTATTLASSPTKPSSNLLTWQTANEINNKGFQVERLKTTGNDWEILGFVAANTKHSNYELTDNTPLSISYYRLRQIDNDGKEVLSKVVSVALKGSKGLTVYPTIVSNGFLNVETLSSNENTEGSVYGIYNLLGQQVIKAQMTPQIDVSTLRAGTYIIRVGEAQAKFMKQ